MFKKSGLLLLPLVAAMILVGAGPSQAAGPTWTVTGVSSTGCAAWGWELAVNFAGFDGVAGDYIAHTTVTSGGLVYMNEEVHNPGNGDEPWVLDSLNNYGPTTGTWPIPSGQPMRVTLSLEKPKGTVAYSWSLVAQSCDSNTLALNAADFDRDFVADADDACPQLGASTANGCPARDRTLTLRAKSGPRRVVGRLYASGYPALYAGRTVTVWKVRPGPDRRVATRTTNSLGRFKARVGKGRYYATSADFVSPTSGEALAGISNRTRVH